MFRRALPTASLGVAAALARRMYATRYFTESHEWVEVDGANATVGITNHAQEVLGDVVFVSMPAVGDAFTAKATFGEVEYNELFYEIYAPVSGTVTAVNNKVKDDPSLVNSSPEADGWLIKLKDVQVPEQGLMNAADYEKFFAEYKLKTSSA